MSPLHLEAICTEDGVITLRDLPVHPGDSVEVIVRPRTAALGLEKEFPLRGEAVEYRDPFEPVAGEDWEALR